MINANKEKLHSDDALALAKSVNTIWVSKGKKVLVFDMKKAPPEDDDLLAEILGRSGTLRAPAIRLGKRLLVGFHPETYAEIFG